MAPRQVFRRLKELVTDSATYGASSALGGLIGFFMLPLYTRLLSPADYGIMAMLALLAALFPPVANLGMTNAIFRRFNVSKDRAEQQLVLGTGAASVLLGSGVLLAITLTVAEPFGRLLFGMPERALLVQLTLITAALASVAAVPTVILRAERRVRLAAGLNLLRLSVSVSLTVWLVAFERIGVLGVVLGSLVGEGTVLVAAFSATARSFRPTFDRGMWKKMVSYGLPFLPHRVQTIGLTYFGQYLIRVLLGLQPTGLYNIALKVATPVSFVVTSVQRAWVPIKFQIHAEDENPGASFSFIASYYFAVLSYLWVGVSLWGPEVVRLMTTEEFHGAALLVPVVALIPITQSLYFVFGTGFGFSDDTKPAPLVSLAGLATLTVSSLILIPTFGPAGAALGTVGAWFLMARLIYRLAQARFPVSYDWQILTRFALAALIVVSGGLAAQSQPSLPRLLYAGAVSILFPFALLWVISRSPTESQRLRQTLRLLARARDRGWVATLRERRSTKRDS